MPAITVKSMGRDLLQKSGMDDLYDTAKQTYKDTVKAVDPNSEKDDKVKQQAPGTAFKDVSDNAQRDINFINSQAGNFTLVNFASACGYRDHNMAKKVLDAVVAEGGIKELGSNTYAKTPTLSRVKVSTVDPWLPHILQGEQARLTMLHRASLISPTVKSPLED